MLKLILSAGLLLAMPALNPPKLLHTGAAKQMFLRDPNGIKIELNEILKKPN